MRTIIALLLINPFSAFAEQISFKSDFPDQVLRGKAFNLSDRDYGIALRLRTLIYIKERQIVDHVRSCSPNSKNWKEEALRWNELRSENWAMIKELRSIVSRSN